MENVLSAFAALVSMGGAPKAAIALGKEENYVINYEI